VIICCDTTALLLKMASYGLTLLPTLATEVTESKRKIQLILTGVLCAKVLL
jgi:hypothetical protein